MQQGKPFKWALAVLSLGYIAIGLLFLLAPKPSTRLISYLLAGVAALAGVIAVILYLARGLKKPHRAHVGLATGVVLLAAAVYLLVRPLDLWDFLPTMLGFGILFDSVLKLELSFEMRGAGMVRWWLFAVLALLTAVMGIVLIIGPFSGSIANTYFAVSLQADGAASLFTLFFSLFFSHKKAEAKAEAKAKAEAEALPPDEAPLPFSPPAAPDATLPPGPA